MHCANAWQQQYTRTCTHDVHERLRAHARVWVGVCGGVRVGVWGWVPSALVSWQRCPRRGKPAADRARSTPLPLAWCPLEIWGGG